MRFRRRGKESLCQVWMVVVEVKGDLVVREMGLRDQLPARLDH